jgi:hypothetical protein
MHRVAEKSVSVPCVYCLIRRNREMTFNTIVLSHCHKSCVIR